MRASLVLLLVLSTLLVLASAAPKTGKKSPINITPASPSPSSPEDPSLPSPPSPKKDPSLPSPPSPKKDPHTPSKRAYSTSTTRPNYSTTRGSTTYTPYSTTRTPTTTASPYSTSSRPSSTTSSPYTTYQYSTSKSPTTSTPYSTTNRPSSTTYTPYSTTSPYSTTNRPSSTTSPYSTSSRPSSTSSSPYTTYQYSTSKAPTTSSPYSTTNRPSSTTSTPYSTTNRPSSTTSTPYSTTNRPGSTTSTPYSTTNRPGSTTSSPYSTTRPSYSTSSYSSSSSSGEPELPTTTVVQTYYPYIATFDSGAHIGSDYYAWEATMVPWNAQVFDTVNGSAAFAWVDDWGYLSVVVWGDDDMFTEYANYTSFGIGGITLTGLGYDADQDVFVGFGHAASYVGFTDSLVYAFGGEYSTTGVWTGCTVTSSDFNQDVMLFAYSCNGEIIVRNLNQTEYANATNNKFSFGETQTVITPHGVFTDARYDTVLKLAYLPFFQGGFGSGDWEQFTGEPFTTNADGEILFKPVNFSATVGDEYSSNFMDLEFPTYYTIASGTQQLYSITNNGVFAAMRSNSYNSQPYYIAYFELYPYTALPIDGLDMMAEVTQITGGGDGLFAVQTTSGSFTTQYWLKRVKQTILIETPEPIVSVDPLSWEISVYFNVPDWQIDYDYVLVTFEQGNMILSSQHAPIDLQYFNGYASLSCPPLNSVVQVNATTYLQDGSISTTFSQAFFISSPNSSIELVDISQTTCYSQQSCYWGKKRDCAYYNSCGSTSPTSQTIMAGSSGGYGYITSDGAQLCVQDYEEETHCVPTAVGQYLSVTVYESSTVDWSYSSSYSSFWSATITSVESGEDMWNQVCNK